MTKDLIEKYKKISEQTEIPLNEIIEVFKILSDKENVNVIQNLMSRYESVNI